MIKHVCDLAGGKRFEIEPSTSHFIHMKVKHNFVYYQD